MKVTVCIGSSCHLKGSRQVVSGLKSLIEQSGVSDRVFLCGAFCLGKCQEGVCVSLDDRICSVSPDSVEAFFRDEILKNL
ncbi:MAG: NAD(P)H-dependent oxidoreductase subunit E [Eubacteriales bacterium]|nr:NAD(P)H-dependent oxidoreductase subunit E [Eubacteriales bacterium]